MDDLQLVNYYRVLNTGKNNIYIEKKHTKARPP